jgi:hypothetical protein
MRSDPATAVVADLVHSALLGEDPTRVADRHEVAAAVRRAHPLLGDAEVDAVADAVSARATGLGPLEPSCTTPRSPRSW